MRRLTTMRFSVATLFLLLIIAVVLQNIASATAAASLTIGSNYSLVSSKRISSTVYEYVYRAQLTNSGAAANNVAATLTSTPQGVTIVDGALSFGNVAAGAVVSSSDTFTVRHDRQYPFNANALAWSTTFDPTFAISGYVTTAQGVTVTVYGPQTKSTVTDAGGVFSLEGLLPGQYTVSPMQPGSVFTPVRQTVTLINQDITGLVFVPQVPEETLSDEDIERIAATPSIFIPEDQVILPNGISLRDYLLMRGITITPGNSAIASASTHRSIQLGRAIAQSTLPPTADPQQKKNDVIAAMLAQARLYACGKDNPPCTTWDHDAEKDEQGNDLPNKPAQKGLTYVYGGKDHTVRTLPTDNCTEMTYGLDCSGFIHHVAKSVGIGVIEGGVSKQRPPEAWAIPSAWQLEMKSITVTDGSNIETGDILVWPSHIGIAQRSDNFISSAGAPNRCATNINGSSGPKSYQIKGFSGPNPTSILRLVVKTPPPPAHGGTCGGGFCPLDYPFCSSFSRWWGDGSVYWMCLNSQKNFGVYPSPN
ncbi:exported hypothetical protein [Candidatus Contendobacter odensis Run_B_J11]|uniref:NlpC/P60 domain-containing protein n=2 Tax=Candidatus Contendibacter odensensis TaxID=1400860 RepID=A0A7U7GBL1_9GAMM|nr:exported hypothetical protein [Candidatus Contendobacter odensis Run_B_J11]